MNRIASKAASVAILMLSAQPCFAADDFRDRDLGARSAAAFAGASVKLRLGQGNQLKPEARLQLGMRHSFQTSAAVPRQVPMLELGSGKTGKAAFYMAGHDLGETERRLGVRGSTGTILLVVGLAVVALAIAAATEKEKEIDYALLCPGGCRG